MELASAEETRSGYEKRMRQACVVCGIPDHMHDAVVQYVVDRQECGGFFMALVSNDFMETASRADHKNLASLGRWARLIYNHFPTQSWGSPKKVQKWLGQEVSDAE